MNIKKSHFFTLALLLTLVIQSCQKNQTIYDAHFYTNVPSTEETYLLFIDGQYKGKLPFSSQNLECSSATLNSESFTIFIEAGKHKLEIRDSQSKVVIKGDFKVTQSRTQASNKGYSSLKSNMAKFDKCLIFSFKK